jgi:hypothetical protein
MPQLENQKESNFTRRSLDREQLEYTLHKTLTYGVIAFTAVGVLASVTYVTIQQLKK